MTNIMKNVSKKADNDLFTSTLTFCNQPASFDSTYAQSQCLSIEGF